MSRQFLSLFVVFLTNALLLSQGALSDALTSVEKCKNSLKIWDTRDFHTQDNQTVFSQEESLKILATMLWMNDVTYAYVLASMKMAYDDFCAKGGIEDLKTELILIDDQCDPSVAVPVFVDMKEVGLDVIFGVKCSKVTIPSGYILTHWDIPLISMSSNNPDISNKDVYSTVIRVGMGYKQIGYAFVEIFKAFNWDQASIISEDDGLCVHGSNYVNTALKEHNMRVAEYRFVDRRAELPDELYGQLLDNFRERARILIVCMSEERIVRLMETARDKGMISSEFVFLTLQVEVSETTFTPWGSTEGMSEADIRRRREAFQHLKIVTPIDVDSLALPDFVEEAQLEMSRMSVMNLTTEDIKENVPLSYGLYMYDTMHIYLDLVNKTRKTGGNPHSGKVIFDNMRNIITEGKSGELIMDDDADRIPIYWFWQLNPGDSVFTSFATLRTISPEGERLHLTATPYWGTADGQPPPDKPVCGYRHELCPPDNSGRDKALIGGFSAFALVIIVGFCSFIYYKKKQFEENLQKMTWKILYEEIDFLSKGRHRGSRLGLSTRSIASAMSQNSETSINYSIMSRQIFTTVGTYKGATCAIKKVDNPDYRPSREDLIQLKLMKDLNHENLNMFLGICFHGNNIHILTQYCNRGSLQDILEQDEIKLDWMFKSSLIQDLTNGMAFIHDSELASHGHLKSPNCLIDGRWVLKISNFGFQMLQPAKQPDTRGEYERYRDDLWTAPELLRMDQRPTKGSQKGDAYSFAIILQEILYRALPYFTDLTPPKDVITKVKAQSNPPYRPEVPKVGEETDPVMTEIMKECWSENPSVRPEFGLIKKRLAQMNKGKNVNILDSMVAKLESYANNLEDIVEKRTEELVEEKKKTDLLLYRMLPSVVAEKLKHGLPVQAEIFESVTIYFSDVVGFTSIASESSPVQIVDLLNDLYTLFDASIAKYDVYKVETIGDAYMCVSGLPNKNGERHAAHIADMSLDLRSNLNKFKIKHMPARPLMIRIGLHSGSCAAGVVGLIMPRYCLFGDTVNVASRMESNGEAMKIHISETTCNLLRREDRYDITARGQVELKGKGVVNSYWLDEKRA